MLWLNDKIEELVQRAIELKVGDVVLSLCSLAPIVDPCDGHVAGRITSLKPLKWVKVTFYTGFGWLTDEEFTNLRQQEPRTAP